MGDDSTGPGEEGGEIQILRLIVEWVAKEVGGVGGRVERWRGVVTKMGWGLDFWNTG